MAAMARRYLEAGEVADLLHQSRSTLYNWRCRGEGPPAVRIGRKLLYPSADLERWLAQRAAEQGRADGAA